MSGDAVYGGYAAGELQEQYSARAAVPAHPAIFERWQAESAAWRAEATATGRARLALAYGARERERIDLFLPASSPTNAPLHAFLHGGYWQSMERGDFSFVARGLTAAGFAVAVVGYPLCPDVTLADIVDSTRNALDWLHARADGLGLSSGPIHVSGHSAGGHLAAMAAVRDARIGAAPIAGIAPVSGVFELEPLVYTRINAALRLDVATARALSVHEVEPPTGVRLDAFVGGDESDEFQRQSGALVAAWETRAGEAALLHRVTGRNHFTLLDALYAPDGPMVAAARAAAG